MDKTISAAEVHKMFPDVFAERRVIPTGEFRARYKHVAAALRYRGFVSAKMRSLVRARHAETRPWNYWPPGTPPTTIALPDTDI